MALGAGGVGDGGADGARRPGPWVKLGEAVNRLNLEDEDASFVAGRLLMTPFDWLVDRIPELKPDVLDLMGKIEAAIEARVRARLAATANRTWRWELRRVDTPAP